MKNLEIFIDENSKIINVYIKKSLFISQPFLISTDIKFTDNIYTYYYVLLTLYKFGLIN